MTKKLSGKELAVIIGCCLIFGSIGGLGQNCRGIFYPAITADLNISMSKLTLYTTFYGVCSALFMTTCCKWFQKVNAKLFLALMCLLYGVPMFLMSFAQNALWFYVLGSVQGIGGGFVCFFPMQHIIGNWFPDRKGTVLGIVLLSSGIAGLFINPWAAGLIAAHGWRFVYRLLSVIILGLTLFASLILIDRSPEDVGLTARRTGAAGTVKKEEFLAKESSILDLAILFFYVLAVALFIGVSQHLSKFALELGKTAEFGGLLVSASMAGNLAAKAVLGPLNDKIGGRKSTILASAFIGLGSFAVLFSQADAVLFVTAFSVGVIMAVTALQTPLLFRSCTTKEQFDRLYPTECSINTMFTSVSQFFLSAIFDLFGNYTYVFAACGGTLLIGAVVLLILDRSVRSKMAA